MRYAIIATLLLMAGCFGYDNSDVLWEAAVACEQAGYPGMAVDLVPANERRQNDRYNSLAPYPTSCAGAKGSQ